MENSIVQFEADPGQAKVVCYKPIGKLWNLFWLKNTLPKEIEYIYPSFNNYPILVEGQGVNKPLLSSNVVKFKLDRKSVVEYLDIDDDILSGEWQKFLLF